MYMHGAHVLRAKTLFFPFPHMRFTCLMSRFRGTTLAQQLFKNLTAGVTNTTPLTTIKKGLFQVGGERAYTYTSIDHMIFVFNFHIRCPRFGHFHLLLFIYQT